VRVCELVSERHSLAPQALVDACLDDATAFRSGAPRADDLTLMAIRRSV
jgi:serine phosphatase RsbU (regulator of sigma subunit)